MKDEANPLGAPSHLDRSHIHRGRRSVVERQFPKLQGLPVTKAVIYRNVDKKAWEQIARWR